MGKEISITVSGTVSKNGMNNSLKDGGGTLDLTGTEFISNVQTLSTSEAAINFGGCDQIQFCILANAAFQSDGVTPNTANIVIGLANPIVTPISTIPPGKAAVLFGPPTTMYVKSSAGTPDLLTLAAEN